MERPKKTAVAGLPDDPLVEILSRLPVKELHRSKCVSKGWRDLIADPLHHKKLPQTLHGFFPSCVGELGSFINLSGGSASAVDPSFHFLKKLPGIHNIWLRASCNGLLLFRHSTLLRELGYIVFNPATEQWAAVPSEHTLADRPIRLNHTCFVFDPAVSPYFHLVIISAQAGCLATVQSYSSETGVWRHTQIDWDEEVRRLGRRDAGFQIRGAPPCPAIFNSMLYLIMTNNKIFEVDVEGKTKRIIRAPSSVGGRVHGCSPLFIGQSQGCLYCINEEHWPNDVPSELSSRVYRSDSNDYSNLLSIWVLEDYDTQKWALKHSVSCSRLFGRTGFLGYNVVAIHPDNSNFIFIVHRKLLVLMSYGLNSKQMRLVGTFQESSQFPPYVPCFSDFLSVPKYEEKRGVGL